MLRIVLKGDKQKVYGKEFSTTKLYKQYKDQFNLEEIICEHSDLHVGLRPYQYRALLSAYDHYRAPCALQAKIAMPTGSGKSIVIALCAYAIGTRVLVLTSLPSLSNEVLKHLVPVVDPETGVTRDRFSEFTNVSPGQFVAMCHRTRGDVDAVPEVVLIGDGENVEAKLAAVKGGQDKPVIVVVNYHKLSQARRDANNRTAVAQFGFDTLITDETHHSGATSYEAITGLLPTARKLGFSATPWHNINDVLADYQTLFALSVEDAVTFRAVGTPVLHKLRIKHIHLSPRQAIEDSKKFSVCSGCGEHAEIVGDSSTRGWSRNDPNYEVYCLPCAMEKQCLDEEPADVTSAFRRSRGARMLVSGQLMQVAGGDREREAPLTAVWALLTHALLRLVEKRATGNINHKALVRCQKDLPETQGGFKQMPWVLDVCRQIIHKHQKEWGVLKVRTFSGSETQQALQQELDSDNIQVVVVKDKLGEGYDDKSFSVVAIVSYIGSTIKFSQLVGRAMRMRDTAHPDADDNAADVFALDDFNVDLHWQALKQPVLSNADIPNARECSLDRPVIAATFEMQPEKPLI